MDTKTIIPLYENVIIQIATPYSTGTGFYLKSADLIVTNEHVIRGNKNCVIAGKNFEKQLVEVLYMDTKYDLAFIKSPDSHQMPDVRTGESITLDEGDKVIAIGHPFDLKYTVTQGIISSLLHKEGDIDYIQHDAALNPGNSGGPLVDMNGFIIGINTFIIQNGNSIGFSLPVTYLIKCIEEFKKGGGGSGVRCPSCKHISFEKAGSDVKYCPVCGTHLMMISQIDDYEPYGVCNTVEEIIGRLGYPVALTRKGPNTWSLNNGSAIVNISYYEKTGLLVGDVYLCTLPENKISELYYFLLRENFTLEGMTLSIREQDIILSLLIYDQYINTETMYKLFKNLLSTAARYDNMLVDTFGAHRKNANHQK
jgi:serine protease Do